MDGFKKARTIIYKLHILECALYHMYLEGFEDFVFKCLTSNFPLVSKRVHIQVAWVVGVEFEV